MQALKNLPKFSFKSTFKNWLYGIAKHLILAHYRQKYNQTPLELDDNTATPQNESQDEKESKKNNRLLEDLLKALPERYHQVLELRFLKGYTILETAAALGISEENTKVLQHRALKKANQIASEMPEAS